MNENEIKETNGNATHQSNEGGKLDFHFEKGKKAPSFKDMPPEVHRKLSSMGGLKAKETKRRKKNMREWAEEIGKANFKFKLPDGTDVDGDLAGAVVMKQYQLAITGDGDTKAAEFLAKLRGEDVQRHEVSVNEDKQRLIREALAKAYGIADEEEAQGNGGQD